MTEGTRAADERALRELDARWYGVYPERDTATADKLAADHFVAVFADGKVGDKATELEWIAERMPDLESLEAEDTRVHFFGDGVALTVSRLAARAPGQEEPSRVVNCFLYVKREGGWRNVIGQTTPILGEG